METVNIQFGDCGSYADWGLLLEKMKISFPDPKTKQADLPGADGSLDLTDVNGPTRYENRKIELTFSREAEYGSWHSLASRIASALHGKRLKAVFDTDPGYFYEGRFTLESEKSNDVMAQVTITGDVEPYKYDFDDGTGDWLWDTFDFETGIIREYANIPINGRGTIIVDGRDKYVEPVITCSAPMVLACGSVTIELPEGTTKAYELPMGPGEHELKFTGTGVVTVAYRGGIL